MIYKNSMRKRVHVSKTIDTFSAWSASVQARSVGLSKGPGSQQPENKFAIDFTMIILFSILISRNETMRHGFGSGRASL